jgi:HAD superfamily hydrolase (TIGR01662 family)
MWKIPKLVLLDFDGVVVKGSNEAYFDCYHKALESVDAKLAPEIEHERILEGWGSGHVEQLTILLRERQELVNQAGKTWVACVDEPKFWENIELVPNADKAIHLIEQKMSVAIVSGSRKDHIEKLLSRFGIDGERMIFSSYDVADPSLRKPNPYTLRLALERFNCSSSEAIYVGDMPNDIVMARAAGIEPVVVLTGELDEKRAKEFGVSRIEQDLYSLAKKYVKST